MPPEGLLSVTEFLKRRVALPFTGCYIDFRDTVRHELVHVFQLSLVAEVFQRYPRVRRVEPPLWWSEGLAEFFSAGEDSRDEMILRDLTLSGRLPTLRELAYAAGGIVYPVGGVIHRFLALSSGEWRIGELYRDLWKYSSFEDAVQGVYGRPLDQLSDEWQFWMRRRYYPSVAAGEPLALTARVLTKLAIKPAVYPTGDSAGGILYFSPSTGYTNIYAQPFAGGRARAVVKGERTAEFESFHFFESRLDVSPAGVVVFSSKYLDRDAVFFWSLARQQVVGRYQFPQLVSILSPTWAPDGRSVVFSGLAVSGYSDLYRLWLADGRLEPLTADRYQDLDPTFSADGRTVVFSSDRTAYGPGGALNLFRLDLATGRIDYLTYGDWRDEQPRWSAETGRIYFASDRDGTYQIYAVDSTGAGYRLTSTVNGAFHPQWAGGDRGLVVGGFADLGDHPVLFTRSSFQGEGLGNQIDHFNGTAFYLHQSRSVNWGVGAFRLRGLFYEGDLQNLFEETAVGAFGQVRYPLSRFRRLEAEYRIEHSDRLDLTDTSGSADVRRLAWLASNFFSYVEDNTLWLSTGPS